MIALLVIVTTIGFPSAVFGTVPSGATQATTSDSRYVEVGSINEDARSVEP